MRRNICHNVEGKHHQAFGNKYSFKLHITLDLFMYEKKNKIKIVKCTICIYHHKDIKEI